MHDSVDPPEEAYQKREAAHGRCGEVVLTGASYS